VAAQLSAAVSLAAAFGTAPGKLEGVLALPWLAFAAGISVRAIAAGRRTHAAELGGFIALVYVPIGAAWAAASRFGLEPAGFHEPIVCLTAVHFHYAGFVLPLVVGLAAADGNRLARMVTIGIAVGVPFVAVGITAGGLLDFAAAWFMAAVTVVAACVLLGLAARQDRPLARAAFSVAGASLAAGMGLVLVYALGVFTGKTWLTIPQMIAWHGTIHAFGFALPALIGWHLTGLR
jgi:hypothetical protein